MLPNAQEYWSQEKQKQDVDVAAQRRQLTVLAQAEVLAENMTRVREWDLFLSYISAAREECVKEIDKMRVRISDPMIVDHAEVMRLKVLLEGWTQRKNAFEAVMSLPKDLLEMGSKAKALADRMPNYDPTDSEFGSKPS